MQNIEENQKEPSCQLCDVDNARGHTHHPKEWRSVMMNRNGYLLCAVMLGFVFSALGAALPAGAATGDITTVAGDGFIAGAAMAHMLLDNELRGGFSGDGGPATAASPNRPSSVFVDSAGGLFIADTFNARIRKVDAQTGVVSTVVGNGEEGFAGDGGRRRRQA